LGRIIFVPGTDASGWPYTSFNFVANDGEADSAPAATTVNILFAPVINNASDAWSNGVFSLGFNGNANAVYRVWTSTNLFDWVARGAASQTSPGVFQFTDSSATNVSQRFYRVTCP